ncbi:thiosulfate sulfurtransferase-like isoform X1 [Dysidea avara]|uniref:thiosulfate sulfurtransferase-like isoform X1 n=2 Tax=Dysidea avara TaxID=196820 RepID=UPI00331F6A3C
MEPPKFVTADWLKEEVSKPDTKTRVVDATWHRPGWKRNASAEHESCRIKGAVHMNLNVVRDTESDWPNAIPSMEHFEKCIGDLGIINDTPVVLYDNNEDIGMYSVARAWLLFKLFGHTHVAILDGGIPSYLKSGGPTESGPPHTPQSATYKASFIKVDEIRSYEQMLFNFKEKLEQVVDARPAGRFNGTEPEPLRFAYLPSGHMIGSYNIPYGKFLRSDTKTMKSAEELKIVFQEAGVDLDKPVVASCGSGITACWIVVAGLLCGMKSVPLYDNSWTEWVHITPADTKTVGVKGVDMK